ncbi:MAG: hypothetical protein HC855_05280 [Rhizobiales bacterium]|nr:hypothetical protein [Hyphomicrobiales bacterium]
MYSLIQTLGARVALSREALPFATAFLIAEFFYKFKSFALECIAFIATWYILSWLQSLVTDKR